MGRRKIEIQPITVCSSIPQTLFSVTLLFLNLKKSRDQTFDSFYTLCMGAHSEFAAWTESLCYISQGKIRMTLFLCLMGLTHEIWKPFLSPANPILNARQFNLYFHSVRTVCSKRLMNWACSVLWMSLLSSLVRLLFVVAPPRASLLIY